MILAFQVLFNLFACLCLQIRDKGAHLDRRSEGIHKLALDLRQALKTLVCYCLLKHIQRKIVSGWFACHQVFFRFQEGLSCPQDRLIPCDKMATPLGTLFFPCFYFDLRNCVFVSVFGLLCVKLGRVCRYRVIFRFSQLWERTAPYPFDTMRTYPHFCFQHRAVPRLC